MKVNKKKLIGSLTIGGLVLSAPFAAFAISNNNIEEQKMDMHHSYGTLLDEPNYAKQIEKLDNTIEKKIKQANYLIEELGDDSDIDIEELENIITDFSELESFLESIDVSSQDADYLKEIFLEYKEEATSLTSEFRTIITSDLSESEIEELRESMKSNFGYEHAHRGLRFNAETLEIIDSDLAQAYANGDMTDIEIAEAVKEIMDNMTQDEREDLHTQFQESGIRPMKGSHMRGNFAN